MATPTEGALVLHHGRYHTIKALPKHAKIVDGKPVAFDLVVFENDGYEVKALATDLKWSEKHGAFYLPGRVLSRNERAILNSITGSWPPADNHLASLQMLDAVDLDSVSVEKLVAVISERKADAVAEAKSIAEMAAGNGGDPDEAFKAALTEYAKAAIAQAAKLRKHREEK